MLIMVIDGVKYYTFDNETQLNSFINQYGFKDVKAVGKSLVTLDESQREIIIYSMLNDDVVELKAWLVY